MRHGQTFKCDTSILSLGHLPSVLAQDARQPTARVGVILDDQHPWARMVGMAGGECLLEVLAADRFSQISRSSESVASCLLIDDRHHDDRDITEVVVALEFLESTPAVEIRHQDVKSNERWPDLTGELNPLPTTLGRHDIEAFTRQNQPHDV